ncbi:GtrA family protein [Roseobacter sp. YSTF-M11]|uniref:GtrA family protein n=1 Tax=Roseobacter insulae TaxID=2859783 RepID=A0A9X1FXQ1_9RHOB|nr:GtrA family protein [Roseobacter insulae]MBW4709217.1 GtrA family protein [Roseobacter insulae]
MIAQLSRFAGVGVVATIVHVLVALTASMGFGLSPQGANLCGFAVAVLLSYLGHGKVTFNARLEHRFHAPRFLVVSGAGLAVSSGLTQIIAVHLEAPFVVAMGVVAVAVPAATFLLCRFWVFSPPHLEGP